MTNFIDFIHIMSIYQFNIISLIAYTFIKGKYHYTLTNMQMQILHLHNAYTRDAKLFYDIELLSFTDYMYTNVHIHL